MALSPDGKRVAYLIYKDGSEALAVHDFDEGRLAGVSTERITPRSVSFAGSDHVILVASKTTSVIGYRGRLEYSAAFSFNLENKKIRQLLISAEELYPAQEGLGNIVGASPDGKHLLMPGFSGKGYEPPYSLFKVNLGNGRARIVSRGAHDVIDWFVDAEGEPFVREEFNNERDRYRIRVKDGGGWQTILEEEETPRRPYSLWGAKSDESALVLRTTFADSNFSALYELGFDGKISPAIFSREDAGVERILTNMQRQVLGVQYTGVYPTYEFFDAGLTEAVRAAQNRFGAAAASLVSWSDDFNTLLLYVQGGVYAGAYFIFDRESFTATMIANARPDIAPQDIGQVLTIEYKARDGLVIPALLTMPADGTDKGAPLIVMPHGGPEAYDAVGFDWMAQYFASRGYMVFQPNFRGSSGFGKEFRDAGRGEWGGKMQDDITDGVNALIRSGRVDPARVCIIGASYGGYAALAGGAFTPDLYQCVGAIAPVADLPLMLSQERRDHGKSHWVYDYWTELIGDPRASKEKIAAISPVNAADAFTAPVLLIHGRNDLVVPIRQSERMRAALERAGKPVTLIRLKGEDHWLSSADTRLEALKALAAFVEEHIGESASSAAAAE